MGTTAEPWVENRLELGVLSGVILSLRVIFCMSYMDSNVDIKQKSP